MGCYSVLIVSKEQTARYLRMKNIFMFGKRIFSLSLDSLKKIYRIHFICTLSRLENVNFILSVAK